MAYVLKEWNVVHQSSAILQLLMIICVDSLFHVQLHQYWLMLEITWPLIQTSDCAHFPWKKWGFWPLWTLKSVRLKPRFKANVRTHLTWHFQTRQTAPGALPRRTLSTQNTTVTPQLQPMAALSRSSAAAPRPGNHQTGAHSVQYKFNRWHGVLFHPSWWKQTALTSQCHV